MANLDLQSFNFKNKNQIIYLLIEYKYLNISFYKKNNYIMLFRKIRKTVSAFLHCVSKAQRVIKEILITHDFL